MEPPSIIKKQIWYKIAILTINWEILNAKRVKSVDKLSISLSQL